jgi:hypothetical protein
MMEILPVDFHIFLSDSPTFPSSLPTSLSALPSAAALIDATVRMIRQKDPTQAILEFVTKSCENKTTQVISSHLTHSFTRLHFNLCFHFKIDSIQIDLFAYAILAFGSKSFCHFAAALERNLPSISTLLEDSASEVHLRTSAFLGDSFSFSSLLFLRFC